MIDLNRHPLIKECHALCLMVEGFPASTHQTDTSLKASALLSNINALVLASGALPAMVRQRVSALRDRMQHFRFSAMATKEQGIVQAVRLELDKLFADLGSPPPGADTQRLDVLGRLVRFDPGDDESQTKPYYYLDADRLDTAIHEAGGDVRKALDALGSGADPGPTDSPIRTEYAAANCEDGHIYPEAGDGRTCLRCGQLVR